MKITINKEQKLYVFDHGNYITCMGFEILYNKAKRLAVELNRNDLTPKTKGTMATYDRYKKLVSIVEEKHRNTGFRSKVNLVPEFIGKEGYRVEIIDKYDEKRRFIIGKSTGWIPSHLEIMRSDSHGGISVMGYPFKSVKFLEKKR